MTKHAATLKLTSGRVPGATTVPEAHVSYVQRGTLSLSSTMEQLSAYEAAAEKELGVLRLGAEGPPQGREEWRLMQAVVCVDCQREASRHWSPPTKPAAAGVPATTRSGPTATTRSGTASPRRWRGARFRRPSGAACTRATGGRASTAARPAVNLTPWVNGRNRSTEAFGHRATPNRAFGEGLSRHRG
jgi:hypothetical protein